MREMPQKSYLLGTNINGNTNSKPKSGKMRKPKPKPKCKISKAGNPEIEGEFPGNLFSLFIITTTKP